MTTNLRLSAGSMSEFSTRPLLTSQSSHQLGHIDLNNDHLEPRRNSATIADKISSDDFEKYKYEKNSASSIPKAPKRSQSSFAFFNITNNDSNESTCSQKPAKLTKSAPTRRHSNKTVTGGRPASPKEDKLRELPQSDATIAAKLTKSSPEHQHPDKTATGNLPAFPNEDKMRELSQSDAAIAAKLTKNSPEHQHSNKTTTGAPPAFPKEDKMRGLPKIDATIAAKPTKNSPEHQHSNKTVTGSPPAFSKEEKMRELSQSDVIIAVMGPSGSGKSSFINTIANSNIAVGHELESCTSEISTVRLFSPDLADSDIVFVDTPGFDHTTKTDIEILKMVADWLKTTYQKDILLSGLLYCHRILNTQNQMAATSMRHLRIFEELCGKNALQNVILVTTMWDEVDEDTGTSAEEMMKTKYWNKMLERKSTTGRFLGTRESAVQLLQPLIDAANKRSSLLLQHEMVDMGKKLNETSAGRHLFARAERMVRQRQEVIQQIRTELNRSNADTISLQPIQAEHQRLAQIWESTAEELRALNPPVGRRFLEISEKWISRKILRWILKRVNVQGDAADRTEGEASRASYSKELFDEILGETRPEVDSREGVTTSREGGQSSSHNLKDSPNQPARSDDPIETKILPNPVI